MDQCLVIAVLVARTELQMAAEKQPDVIFKSGQDNVLIAGIAREDDLIRVDVVFRRNRDAFGLRQTDSQSAQDDEAKESQGTHRGKLVCEQESAPQRDRNIDDPEQHGGTHKAEVRDQKNRKEKRRPQRTEIIEGQDMCYNVAKVITVANNAHQQRDFQTNENSDYDHEGVHQKLKSLGVGERQKQQGGRKTSNHTQQQFDPHKTVGETGIDVTRKSAADPHREQVTANDRGKLKNAVAEKVAGERSRDELVDEPAGGDQQDRDEKQNSQGFSGQRTR